MTTLASQVVMMTVDDSKWFGDHIILVGHNVDTFLLMLILFYTTHALFDQNVSDVKTRQASTAITAVTTFLSEMADGTFLSFFNL